MAEVTFGQGLLNLNSTLCFLKLPIRCMNVEMKRKFDLKERKNNMVSNGRYLLR